MKLNTEELKAIKVEDLAKQLKESGINENRLDKAVTSSFLPEKGKFDRFEVSGEGSFKHVRIFTEKGESISASRLQLSGFEGEPNLETDVLESSKGTFYLRSNHTPNPSFSGNQAALLKRIIGKGFTAEPVPLKVTKFMDGGYDSKDEVVCQNVTAYKVTMK